VEYRSELPVHDDLLRGGGAMLGPGPAGSVSVLFAAVAIPITTCWPSSMPPLCHCDEIAVADPQPEPQRFGLPGFVEQRRRSASAACPWPRYAAHLCRAAGPQRSAAGTAGPQPESSARTVCRSGQDFTLAVNARKQLEIQPFETFTTTS